MADPIRVVFRSRGGSPFYQASEEAQAQHQQATMRLGQKWKEDPGIRFLCYYLAPGVGLDGFGHHYIFEIDDISKVREMDHDIWTNKDLLIDEFSLELVFGNAEVDGFFQS